MSGEAYIPFPLADRARAREIVERTLQNLEPEPEPDDE